MKKNLVRSTLVMAALVSAVPVWASGSRGSSQAGQAVQSTTSSQSGTRSAVNQRQGGRAVMAPVANRPAQSDSNPISSTGQVQRQAQPRAQVQRQAPQRSQAPTAALVTAGNLNGLDLEQVVARGKSLGLPSATSNLVVFNNALASVDSNFLVSASEQAKSNAGTFFTISMRGLENRSVSVTEATSIVDRNVGPALAAIGKTQQEAVRVCGRGS